MRTTLTLIPFVVAMSVGGCSSSGSQTTAPTPLAPPGTASGSLASSIQLSCPPSYFDQTRGIAPNAPAASPSVSETPVRGKICRYAGLNGKTQSGSLIRSARIPHPAALAKELNTGTVPEGVYHCPIDFGGRDLILFGYLDGSVSRLVVSLTGCPKVTFLTPPKGARWLTGEARHQIESLVGSERGPI